MADVLQVCSEEAGKLGAAADNPADLVRLKQGARFHHVATNQSLVGGRTDCGRETLSIIVAVVAQSRERCLCCPHRQRPPRPSTSCCTLPNASDTVPNPSALGRSEEAASATAGRACPTRPSATRGAAQPATGADSRPRSALRASLLRLQLNCQTLCRPSPRDLRQSSLAPLFERPLRGSWPPSSNQHLASLGKYALGVSTTSSRHGATSLPRISSERPLAYTSAQ